MVSKYYEYATWILVIVAIFLSVLLVRAKSAPVDDNLDMAIQNLQECNAELAAWRAVNPTAVNATPEKQEELNSILRRCADATGAEKTDVGNDNMGPEADVNNTPQ